MDVGQGDFRFWPEAAVTDGWLHSHFSRSAVVWHLQCFLDCSNRLARALQPTERRNRSNQVRYRVVHSLDLRKCREVPQKCRCLVSQSIRKLRHLIRVGETPQKLLRLNK